MKEWGEGLSVTSTASWAGSSRGSSMVAIVGRVQPEVETKGESVGAASDDDADDDESQGFSGLTSSRLQVPHLPGVVGLAPEMPSEEPKDEVAEKNDCAGGIDEVLRFVGGIRSLSNDGRTRLGEYHLGRFRIELRVSVSRRLMRGHRRPFLLLDVAVCCAVLVVTHVQVHGRVVDGGNAFGHGGLAGWLCDVCWGGTLAHLWLPMRSRGSCPNVAQFYDKSCLTDKTIISPSQTDRTQ